MAIDPSQYPKSMGIFRAHYVEMREQHGLPWDEVALATPQWVDVEGRTYWGFPLVSGPELVGVRLLDVRGELGPKLKELQLEVAPAREVVSRSHRGGRVFYVDPAEPLVVCSLDEAEAIDSLLAAVGVSVRCVDKEPPQ